MVAVPGSDGVETMAIIVVGGILFLAVVVEALDIIVAATAYANVSACSLPKSHGLWLLWRW